MHALLGELPFMQQAAAAAAAAVSEAMVRVQGSVFYVPQEPWIFSASIRQNIVFGQSYEPKKFNKIVKACCLDEVF